MPNISQFIRQRSRRNRGDRLTIKGYWTMSKKDQLPEEMASTYEKIGTPDVVSVYTDCQYPNSKAKDVEGLKSRGDLPSQLKIVIVVCAAVFGVLLFISFCLGLAGVLMRCCDVKCETERATAQITSFSTISYTNSLPLNRGVCWEKKRENS